MDAVADFFANHMVLVFFAYGLAWFVMGIAIVITPRVSLRFPLAANLPWLAGFGFVHAIEGWLDMLHMMPVELVSFSQHPLLRPTKIGLLVLSGALLLRFGAGLVSDLLNRPRLGRWLPAGLLALWLASPVYTPSLPAVLSVDIASSFDLVSQRVPCLSCHPFPASLAAPTQPPPGMGVTLEVLARYLIYLPAMALSAVGLYLQGRRFQVSQLKGIARAARWAAGIFGANAFLSGLVVAPAPYIPAVWLNYHMFLNIVAVPPQVFRALAAAASAFFIVRVLDVYRAEQERQLEEAREQRLLAERQLSKELSEKMAGLTDVLADLHTLSERVVSDASFEGFIRRKLTQAASSLMRSDCGAIFLQDEAEETYLACTEGPCDLASPDATSMEDVARQCAASGKSVILQDVLFACRPIGGQPARGSVLAVPLLIRGEVLGVISVQAFAPRRFGDEDRSLLETVSGQMAVALQNARLYAQVSEQAIRDGLTGLYNHRYFRERLEEELKRTSQNRGVLSLLFCDLDFFKRFNDANGHQMGDLALQAVAAIMSKCKRGTDLAARYGGEEFTIILPDSDTGGAVVVAERIRREIGGHAFHGPGQVPVRLTASIGVATFPMDATSPAEMIDKADWAMYNAKRNGGNKVWVFSVEKDYVRSSSSSERQSEDLFLSTAHALAAAVDARDHYTHYHSEVVALYSSAIARDLGLAEEEIEEIRTAALLHDVGKIGLRDDILNKTGPLTAEELAKIREHPLVGEDILKRVPSLLRAASFVRHHHERYDGTGYPDRVAGEDIPLGARVIAVADSFHAMISDRPYRPALSLEQALAELRAHAGRQFDSHLVDVFLTVVRHGVKLESAGVSPQRA